MSLWLQARFHIRREIKLPISEVSTVLKMSGAFDLSTEVSSAHAYGFVPHRQGPVSPAPPRPLSTHYM